jgi:hypothetical protein
MQGMAAGHQQQSQQPEESTTPPPASRAALRNLPIVRVTKDDLIEEGNRCCCICLEDQEIGGSVTKLRCGHIFHLPCVKEWLEKSCTCPVCRLELETDDFKYEQDRKKRMATRQFRFRRNELDSMSVRQLKDLLTTLGISIVATNCVEKGDLVARVLSSARVTILEGAPPVEMTRSELESRGVGAIKMLLREAGLETEGALMKAELVERLLTSGRVIILPETPDESSSSERNGGGMEGGDANLTTTSRADTANGTAHPVAVCNQNGSTNSYNYTGSSTSSQQPSNSINSSSSSSSSSSSNSSSSHSHDSGSSDSSWYRPSDTVTSVSRSGLMRMRVAELKRLADAAHVDVSLCVEKIEMIDLISASPLFNLTP